MHTFATALAAGGLRARVAASTVSVGAVPGVERLAAAAVMSPRAFTSGMPSSTPEQDGSTLAAGNDGRYVPRRHPRTVHAGRTGRW